MNCSVRDTTSVWGLFSVHLFLPLLVLVLVSLWGLEFVGVSGFGFYWFWRLLFFICFSLGFFFGGEVRACFLRRLTLNPRWLRTTCNPPASARVTGISHPTWLGSALFFMRRPIRNVSPRLLSEVSACLKTGNFTMESETNRKAGSALVSTKDTLLYKKAPSSTFQFERNRGASCIELSGGMLYFPHNAWV